MLLKGFWSTLETVVSLHHTVGRRALTFHGVMTSNCSGQCWSIIIMLHASLPRTLHNSISGVSLPSRICVLPVVTATGFNNINRTYLSELYLFGLVTLHESLKALFSLSCQRSPLWIRFRSKWRKLMGSESRNEKKNGFQNLGSIFWVQDSALREQSILREQDKNVSMSYPNYFTYTLIVTIHALSNSILTLEGTT